MRLPPAPICNPANHEIPDTKKTGQHDKKDGRISVDCKKEDQKCRDKPENSAPEKKPFGITADRDFLDSEPEATKIKEPETYTAQKAEDIK
jgi:hypothetical protein